MLSNMKLRYTVRIKQRLLLDETEKGGRTIFLNWCFRDPWFLSWFGNLKGLFKISQNTLITSMKKIIIIHQWTTSSIDATDLTAWKVQLPR